MFLKQVELKGFKSFADRTVIDFGEGITCIVGPNGSGKSNITDAFRWVLGEQRYKTLRGSQMQDVIFSGTKHRQALGFAEVTIVFDNSTNFLDIEFEEVTVKRRLYRSGESSYAINDAACRLKDVKQLFMDTGVGVEGYSIIGQGRIDSILSTNKDERRLIFEEAAGIVKYRTRKNDAERKLTRVQENLDRISDIVSELADRVEPLKVQAEKARQYKDYADELKALEVNIFIHDIEAADRKLAILGEDIATRKQAMTERENTLESELAAINELVASIECAERAYQDDLRAIGQLKSDIARLSGELAVLGERTKAAQANRDAKQVELDSLTEQGQTLTEQVVLAKQALAEATDKQTAAERQAQEQLLVVAAIKEQQTTQANQLEQLLAEQANQQAEFNTLEQLSHRLSASDDIAKRRLSTIDQDVKRYRDVLASEATAIDQLMADKQTIADKLAGLTREKQAVNIQIEDNKSAIADLENAHYTQRCQLAEQSTALKALQRQEAQNEGFSHAAKQVLNWSTDDAAVYGSVKDLFTIDAKFFTAIETALGRQLQSIVVDDASAVDSYISRLKTERAGRATFIPIAQIKHRPIPEAESGPGYYGCAYHLIDCKRDVAPAFKYLLSGIYLTDSLADAKRMARTLPNNSRVISLDGDIVNAGGTITGGSLAKHATGYLARKDDIRQLSESLVVLEDEMAQTATSRAALAATREQLLQRVVDKQRQLDALTEQQHALINQLERAEQTVAEAERHYDQADSEVEQLQLSMSERADQLTEHRTCMKAIKDNADERDARIAAIKTAARTCAQHLQLAEEEQTTLTIMHIKQTESVRAAQSELQQLLDRQSSGEHRRHQLERDIERVNEQLLQVDSGKLIGEQSLKDSQEKLTDLTQKTDLHHRNVESDKQKLHVAERDVANDRQALQSEKNDVFKLELDLTRIETRRESLVQNLWENYELSYIKALDFKQDVDIQAYNRRARKLKSLIKGLGDVNLGAIAEYDTVNERYVFLTEQQGDLITSHEQLSKLIRDIDRQMKRSFRDKLTEINGYFSETFSRLFGGGTGNIALSDDDDVLGAEIMIQAQPPGKQLQGLDLLSGGEKALTAISLLFAILKTKPTPFCILDEIEAALDDVNIFRFADFLKDFVKDSQFIIITHRKGTMEIAEYLYGVTMQEQGVTTMLSVALDDAEHMALA